MRNVLPGLGKFCEEEVKPEVKPEFRLKCKPVMKKLKLEMPRVSNNDVYQLGGSNVAELLKLAAEMGVEFKFNSRRYVFELLLLCSIESVPRPSIAS